MSAGEFRDLLRFEKRDEVDDGAGNHEGPWRARFTQCAAMTPLRGGETVIAARLEGRQPAVFKVYCNAETRQITSDWRMVDVRSGAVYAVQSVVDMERTGRFLTIMAEAGVAS